jgi:hypothetical protein
MLASNRFEATQVLIHINCEGTGVVMPVEQRMGALEVAGPRIESEMHTRYRLQVISIFEASAFMSNPVLLSLCLLPTSDRTTIRPDLRIRLQLVIPEWSVSV